MGPLSHWFITNNRLGHSLLAVTMTASLKIHQLARSFDTDRAKPVTNADLFGQSASAGAACRNAPEHATVICKRLHPVFTEMQRTLAQQ
jgi:hypothetical protein